MSDTVVLGVRLPKSLARRFMQKIKRDGYISVSDALRDLIRNYVGEEGKENVE